MTYLPLLPLHLLHLRHCVIYHTHSLTLSLTRTVINPLGNSLTDKSLRHYLHLPLLQPFPPPQCPDGLNNYVSGLITKRWALRQSERRQGRATTRKQDVLDKVLSAITEEEWGPSVVEQIRDEVKTFILAGNNHRNPWILYYHSIILLFYHSNPICSITSF